jgi:predicted acyltransferase
VSQSTERPIVVHGPPTGDADRLAASPRALPDPARLVADRDVVGPLLVTSATAPAVSVAPTERVFGLDALRGFLLLAMNFTFTIPPWGPFAKWMYHTQVPPSATRAYVEVAGLTWQDFIFAMFVFTMAAAIPIAMSGRLAKGKPYPEIILQSLKRGALLFLFALIIGHVNPYWTSDYTKRGNVLSIVGFLVSFALFVQPSPTWRPAVARAVRMVGWVGAATLLLLVPLLYGQTFDPGHRDVIMSALAFATVAGTILWVFTRQRLRVRLLLFGLIVLARTVAPQLGWVSDLWNANPLPWVYEPWYLDLLLVVIPGTIAGDLIWRWMQSPVDDPERASWTSGRLVALAVVALSFIPILCVGLYERRYPLATTLAVIGVGALLLALTRGAATARERVLARLFAWSALWLVLGMFAEPLEGGIKKDPQTLGYLLLMAGSAKAALGALLIFADRFAAGRRQMRPVALIGQNALFAYVILMLFVEHLLWLGGVGDALTQTWPVATARSIALTLLAGVVVWGATRKRLIWKA